MVKERKKELTEEELINWWLEKYHGITVAKLIETEPELAKTVDWFKKYVVTQEQHDEWHDWALREVAKREKISLRFARRGFWSIYLNCAPSVK